MAERLGAKDNEYALSSHPSDAPRAHRATQVQLAATCYVRDAGFVDHLFPKDHWAYRGGDREKGSEG